MAGNGTLGFSGDNAAATRAQLNNPVGVAVDSSGNLFIADQDNQRIRKVDTNGTITTVAGNGSSVFSGDNAAATLAQLSNPMGVAVDSGGNLFIADRDNQRIRKVDTSGTITTVAGDGTVGFSGDNAAATLARMNRPSGVAVDSSGNLFIADYYNRRIRKVDVSGTITTVAGNGTPGFGGDNAAATLAQMNRPWGVAVDSIGNLFIADQDNQRIRKVDTNGIITTVAGNGTGGFSGDNAAATQAQLSSPSGVAVDSSGNLFMADYYNRRIRKVDTSGTITTVAGNGNHSFSGDNAAATLAKLAYPVGVAVDNIGNLFIADQENNRIRKVNTSGTITTVAGNGSYGSNGDSAAATLAQLSGPSGVTVDSSGNLFIADYNNHRIRKVDTNGIITTVAGNGSGGFSGDNAAATLAQLSIPFGVAVDSIGNLFIADQGNSRIRKVGTNGIISTVVGDGTFGFSGDSAAASLAQLSAPLGVAVDSMGNLFIADTYSHRIRKVDTNGIITTVAGNGSEGFSGDNAAATLAQLSYPTGVAVDSGGNLFIADRYNQRIRKVDTNGTITTVAGTSSYGFSGDNAAATSAQLAYPLGVAVDSSGNLFIADQLNHRIRKVDAPPDVAPLAPTNVVATAGDGQAQVSWSVPAANGGSAVTGYTVSSQPPGAICPVTINTSSTQQSCTASGLNNGTSYTFSVVATNAAGNSLPSTSSNAVVPLKRPDAPTNVQALAGAPGSGQVTVSWTAPATSGSSALTGYSVTGSPSGSCTASASATSCVVSTLSFGTSYTFTVTATNAHGGANTSAASNPVVLQNTQSISFPAQASQIYTANGSFAINPLATATSGLPVTYTSTTGSVCTVAGTTVSIMSAGTCTIAADQAGNGNWGAAVQVTQNITITPGTNTINFQAQGVQTYSVGGSFAINPVATASSGLAVTYTTTSAACSVSGTTVQMLSAGSCVITASQAGNSTWGPATPVSQSVTIAKGANTITFPAQAAQSFSSGGTFGLNPVATSTSGLPIIYGTTTPTICSVAGTTVSMAAIGTCTLTANQAGDNNWNAAAQALQTVTIQQGTNTITFPAQANQTYTTGGSFAISPLATATSGLPVTYSTSATATVCGVNGSTVSILAAGICTITASEPGNSNWTAATPTSQNVTILKGVNTITFPAQAAQTFTANGSFAISPVATAASGLVVTYTSTTPGVCSVAGTTVTKLTAGTCTIAVDQGGDGNWAVATQVTQNITIQKGANTITFAAQPAQTFTANGSFAINPTATATSGLAVTYTSTTASVCTVAGTTVTIVTAGTCTIAADQAGNGNWVAATQVLQNVAIGQRTNTITFPAQANQTFASKGTFAINPLATASSNLPITYSSLTSTVCTVSGTTVTMVAAGTCNLAANQAGDSNWDAAAQVTRAVTITGATPGAPTNVQATPSGPGQVTVTWTAPTNTGGGITGYVVTAQPGGQTCTPTPATATTCTMTGLTNGQTYTFTVEAMSAAGSSSSGGNPPAASNPATPLVNPQAFTGNVPPGAGGNPGAAVGVSVSGGGNTCVFEHIRVLPVTSASTAPPSSLSFPNGLLDFVLSGCNTSDVQVTLTLPTPMPQGGRYWKLSHGVWAPYANAVAQVGSTTVTLTLRDGGPGDDDGQVNGRIVDPGQVAVAAAPPVATEPTAVPTLSPAALAMLALVLGWMGWRRKSWR